MSIKTRIQSQLTRALTSDALRRQQRALQELKRKARQSGHTATFYFRIDDPYSYLLAQVLPEIQRLFPALTIQTRVMLFLPAEMYPEPQMLAEYALQDAPRLARFYGLNFPSQPVMPDPETSLTLTRLLLNAENESNFLQVALAVGEALWQGKGSMVDDYRNHFGLMEKQQALALLQQRKNRFIREGHYLTGTLHYGGEWYWGIDRLSHLLDRLRELNLLAVNEDLSRFYQAYQPPGRGIPDNLPHIDFYFSFRSPYSYLALARAFQLADQYQATLNIKPVLPMVMRGLKVPAAKRLYIVTDAKREARRHQIPFGTIADPVGAGVERCLALFPLAQSLGLERQYLLSAARGIWAEGLDVASDRGLRKVVERIGIPWAQARPSLQDESWRNWAEQNRQDLLASGSWGVPTFVFNGETFWGQDRLWALEQAIRES